MVFAAATSYNIEKIRRSKKMEKDGRGITGLAHIGVFVKDVQKSIDFYTGVLGFDFYFQVKLEKDGVVTICSLLRRGTCEIELINRSGVQCAANGVVAHIAMSVDDIESAVKRIREKGIKIGEPEIIKGFFESGIKNVFFSGPDGESLELVEVL
jgi:lactoylglutathione lyase